MGFANDKRTSSADDVRLFVYILTDVIAVKPFDVQARAAMRNDKAPQWVISVLPMIKGYARLGDALDPRTCCT